MKSVVLILKQLTKVHINKTKRKKKSKYSKDKKVLFVENIL